MASPNTKLFSKTLSKTDAKKRLAIPTRSMRSLPEFINGSHAIEIGLISGTKTWPIQYTISKNGPNKRPSFTSGWIQFAACNGLKPGNGISLYKEGSSLYRVEVEEKPVDALPAKTDQPSPRVIGAETGDHVAEEGIETNLSGLAGTSQLDAAGEACCKVITDHPRLGLDLVPENPAQ